MSAIHFDITGDNENIMSVIDQTTKAFEELADYMKDLGKQGLDLSDAEQSVEVLGGVLGELMDQMKQWGEELEALQRKQQDAMMAGDADEVKRLGDEMKALGEKIGVTSEHASKLEAILGTSENGRKELEKLGKTVKDISPEMDDATKSSTKFIKSFLPGLTRLGSIVGITSAVTGAVRKMASDIVSLTQRVSDSWNREVSGWKNTYESFLSSLGSGKGFTQMLEDMGNAYRQGKEYFDFLDELFERENSVKLQEAGLRTRIAENRTRMRDRTLTPAERRKAAEDIQTDTKRIYDLKRGVEQQKSQEALKMLAQRTGADTKALSDFIENYEVNIDEVHRAQDYIDANGGAIAELIAKIDANRKVLDNKNLSEKAKGKIEARIEVWEGELTRLQGVVSNATQETIDLAGLMKQYGEGNDQLVTNYVVAEAALRGLNTQETTETSMADRIAKQQEMQEKKQRAVLAELRRKRKVQDARDVRNNENDARQAEIDAMKEGNNKVLAQIDLDYKKEKEAIKDWYDDLREQKVQKAKELFNANPDNADSIFTYNINDARWDPTEAEKAAYKAKNKAADTNYERNRGQAQRSENDTQNEFLKQYGTYWEQRQAITKEYQDKIDNTDDEWEKKRLAKERDAELKSLARNREYLAESQRYEDRKRLIEEESQDKLEDLQERDTELREKLARPGISADEAKAIQDEIERIAHQKDIIIENTENELEALEQEFGDIYKIIFRNSASLSKSGIEESLKKAKQELTRLTAEGKKVSPDIIKPLLDQITSLESELDNLSFGSVPHDAESLIASLLKYKKLKDNAKESKSLFGEGSEEYRDAEEAVKRQSELLKKGLGQAGAQVFAESLNRAAKAMREIAELSGDTKLADMAEEFGALAQNLSAAAQGFASSGSWIGAVVGGVSDMLSQTIDAFTMATLQEIKAKNIAEQWAVEMKKMAIAVNEADFDTIFGKKNIGLGQAEYKEAQDSLKLYGKELDAINEKYDKFSGPVTALQKKGLQGWDIFTPLFGTTIRAMADGVKLSQEFQTALDAAGKGYQGLQKMQVKTKDVGGWARFWGAEDEYTNLGDLAPELWDKNGEFVVENAEKLLEVNTQLSAEQRQQIKNLIDIKKGYDDAMKAIDDTISQTFGNLASDLTDIIWDSVMNGTDAWDDFQKRGAEAITALGKQLVQEMLISTYLENFREDMRNAYKMDNAEATQRELRNITQNIFNGLGGAIQAGATIAEEWKNWGELNGFNVSTLGDVSGKTWGTMSQSTGDELNGRFAALQISGDMIAQSAQQGVLHLLAISDLMGAGNRTLDEIRNLHIIEVGHLETIATQTKTMLGFGEILQQIQNNTSRL